MKYCVMAAVLLGFLLPATRSEARTWTSNSGKFSIDAELVAVKDGSVELRRADGQSITVPLEKLSEADRKFVADQSGDSKKEDEGASTDEQSRTWKSRGGNFTIEARFVTFKNGKAELVKSDGETIAVSLSKLSEEDGRYVRELLADRRKKSSPSKTAPRATGLRAPRGLTIDLGDEAQTVELKPLLIDAPQGGASRTGDMSQYLLRMVRPQSFYQRSIAGSSSGSASAAAFKQAINKEPEYEAEEPFRGAARLGSELYGFALDAVNSKTPGYGRLFFDVNHNGDLTDDKPVVGISSGNPTEERSQFQFPRVELKLEIEGTEVDYAFVMSVYSHKTSKYSYTSASLAAAAFREGTLGQGRNRVQVVLADSNSNGRFDDLCTVNDSSSSGRVYPVYGDSLLLGPGTGVPDDADANRIYLSKLVAFGERFYEVKVPASGESLSLSPCKAAVGYVTNSCPNFSAIVSNPELGVLKIAGDGSTRVPLPVGQWRLASYTANATQMSGPGRGASSSVSAAATRETEAVTVAEGETVPMPFGTPYRPVVTSSGSASSGKVYLSLAIVGTAGERCTGLRVNGKTPPAPEFQIVDPGGKVVEQGKFAYG